MKLKPLATQAYLKILVESVSGDASAAMSQTKKLSQDLERAGSDADSEEVQAAMLGALVDADGDISKVDVDDVEKIKQDIEENRGYKINEASGGWIDMLHKLVDILGNAALLNAIADNVEKVSGKKLDKEKLKSKMEKLAAHVKTISGWPAKQLEKFFAFVARSLGGGKFAQKIAGYSGTLLATAIMFAFGIAHFPSVGASFSFFFAIGGLLGKGAEMIHMIKEIMKAVQEEMANVGDTTAPQFDNPEPDGSVF
jgi:uncharacterized membrane protein YeaQ/YmgE (transglycosylase-associated protein family)